MTAENERTASSQISEDETQKMHKKVPRCRRGTPASDCVETHQPHGHTAETVAIQLNLCWNQVKGFVWFE